MKGLVVAALLLLVAAGCSSSGFPEAYDDQVDEETGRSNVEQNWLDGCEVGFGEELAEDANAVCECSYTRIKANIEFAQFVEANDRLKSDPESLQERAEIDGTEKQIVEIVRSCIAEG